MKKLNIGDRVITPGLNEGIVIDILPMGPENLKAEVQFDSGGLMYFNTIALKKV